MAAPVDQSGLSEDVRLALVSARAEHKQAFAALFAFDALLERAVADAGEVMLAQIRLAWWRENVSAGLGAAPPRDPVLVLAREQFGEDAGVFAGLVDGWEALLLDDEQALEKLAKARTKVFATLATRRGFASSVDVIDLAVRQWTFAQQSRTARADRQRAAAFALGQAAAVHRPSLPRSLRPLAVLAGLGARAIRRGGTPLLGDRLSPLVAGRIALTGR